MFGDGHEMNLHFEAREKRTNAISWTRGKWNRRQPVTML
jgi:hypothetical protein